MNDFDDRDHRDTDQRADEGRDIPTAADGHDREHSEWSDHRDRDRDRSEWYGHRDHSAARGLRDRDDYRAPRPYDRDREHSEWSDHRDHREWSDHRNDYYRAPQQRNPLTGVIVAVVAVTVLGVGAGAWSVYSEHKTNSSSSGLPWSDEKEQTIEVPTVRGRSLGEFEPVGTVYALPNAPSPRAGQRALDAVPWDHPRVVVVHRASQEVEFAEDAEQCLSGVTDPATYELTGDDVRCIYEMGHARLGYVLEVVNR